MNNESSPLISIIMPAYNSESTIAPSIDSVRSQTLQDWELIIIDDNSSDNTDKIVRPYLIDERIILINLQQNQGVAAARNTGISESKGKYITFLDSDDLWMPEKLEHQIAFHRKNPDLHMSYTDYEIIGEISESSSSLKKQMKDHNKIKSGVPRIYYENMIGILTVMAEKKILVDLGGFDTSLQGTEDHDLWIRMAKAGYHFGYIREKLAKYRLTGGGLSRSLNKYKLQRKKLLRKHYLENSMSPVARLAWGTYYRHFGYEYYKRQTYSLAKMYYFKAIQYFGFGRTGLLMLYFYLRSLLKSLL